MGKANKALNVQGAVANRSKQFLERLFESFKQDKRSCWRKASGTKPQTYHKPLLPPSLPLRPQSVKQTTITHDQTMVPEHSNHWSPP